MITLSSLILFCSLVIAANIYTFKHGIAMWKYEKNKLGAVGTILLTLAGTIFPLYMLIKRY